MSGSRTSRFAALLLAVAILPGACSTSGEPDAVASASQTTIDAVTSTTNLEPIENVARGGECDAAGRLGTTSDGEQMLCSASDVTGVLLDNPQWRDVAGRDLENSPELTVTEQEAVSVARAIDPGLVPVADQTVLLMVSEYSLAMNLAADSGVSAEETFSSLVDGVIADNGVSLDRAVAYTEAMIVATTYLLPGDEPGSQFAVDVVIWLESIRAE